MPLLQAFADESFKEDDGGGFYVLAAAVLPVDRHEELRKVMLGLRAERTGKLHWNVLTNEQKRAVVKRVADFEELHLVSVGAPVPARRQERGRSLCLRRLMIELHALGVGLLVAEGRTAQLDARDVRTIQQSRFRCRETPHFAFSMLAVPTSHCCGSPMSSPGPSAPARKASPTTPTSWPSV